MKKISVILPCFNEEGNIPEIHRQLFELFEKRDEKVQIIFIDDGSTDASLQQMLDIAKKHENVAVVELSRNFGQQASICCGLDYADGDAVIMMDTDLQHPVTILPELIEKWQEGYDIVCTERTVFKGATFFKKITSKLFYKVLNFIGNVKVSEKTADFRLLDKRVVKYLRKLGEKTKFYRGLVNWVGFKRTVVFYEADERLHGKTKYSFFQMCAFALDGIVSFSAFPIRLMLLGGFFIAMLSFGYGLYAVYIKIFTDMAITGWASVLASIVFLAGVQLISLGIIGEYVNRIYIESKNRPAYIARNVFGNDFKNDCQD